MDEVNERRRGFCPSPWSPMASGDGLIVRIRAAAHPLSSHVLRELAGLANTFGNGQIEVTRRANLQLRGLREDGIPELQRELVRLGLAEPTLELERRLGIAASPLGGPELAALGCAIENGLREAGRELDNLPSKFGIVLEGPDGALAKLFGDVRVELDGELAHLSVAGDHSRATWLGACRAHQAPLAVVQLAHEYAALGEDARRNVEPARLHARVAALVVALATPPSAAEDARIVWVGPSAAHELHRSRNDEARAARDSGADLAEGRREARTGDAGTNSASEPANLHAARASSAQPGTYGLGVPFGSAFAETWFAIAALAEHLGRSEIRTTPARSVLLAGVREEHHAELERAADSLGLIRNPHDPLLFVEACPGAPACASALGETRALARELAGSLQGCLGPERSLHVSGCVKGCARSGSASATLVLDQGSCRLGFDLDTALTSLRDAVPLSAARVQLRSWAQRHHR